MRITNIENKIFWIIITIIFIWFVFIGSLKEVFSYTIPPTISVTKPSGTTETLCASGCDYSTLEAADGNIGAGNTLRIKAGTYTTTTWNESGTSGSEVVLEAFGDGDVIIEGETRFQGDFVIIDGGADKEIIFRRTSGAQRLIRVQGDDITIWRVKIEGPTGVCSDTDNAGMLIKGWPTVTNQNNKVYNCIVDSCDHKGIYVSAGNNCEIKNNEIYTTGNNGLQVNPHETDAGIDNLIISGNAIYNNGACGAMRGHNIYIQATTGGDGLSNMYIYNNLLWGSERSGIHMASIGSGTLTGDVMLYNNTIYDNGEYGISFDSTVPDNRMSIANNIMYGNDLAETDYDGGVTLLQNTTNLTTDPTFKSVTQANADFLKLSASSSNAIDSGTDLSAVLTDDYFANSRSNYDIGAHEYLASSSFQGGEFSGATFQ